jgi:hypothetical protein
MDKIDDGLVKLLLAGATRPALGEVQDHLRRASRWKLAIGRKEKLLI